MDLPGFTLDSVAAEILVYRAEVEASRSRQGTMAMLYGAGALFYLRSNRPEDAERVVDEWNDMLNVIGSPNIGVDRARRAALGEHDKEITTRAYMPVSRALDVGGG
jgi:hypothetical protein